MAYDRLPCVLAFNVSLFIKPLSECHSLSMTIQLKVQYLAALCCDTVYCAHTLRCGSKYILSLFQVA